MRKNLKKCKNRPKIDPLLVFVDFYAEGVYGNTFCIKDESKLRTQWFIIEIFKKIYWLVFGWISVEKRVIFWFFAKICQTVENTGKWFLWKWSILPSPKINLIMICPKKSILPPQIYCWKNGPFYLANFALKELADFSEIFWECILGPK